MRTVFAHAKALAAALLLIVAISAVWIVHLRAGPKLDGWVAGAMLLFVPLALTVLFLGWLAVRGILGFWLSFSPPTVLAVSGGIALAVTVLNCGPVACFTMGPERAAGWFVVPGVAITALVHHILLERFLRRSSDGRQ